VKMHQEITLAAGRLLRMITRLPGGRWTDEPWHVEQCAEEELGECPCIVAQGVNVADFREPQDPPIQYIADAETPEVAKYLVAMGPDVAGPLVTVLRRAARTARTHEAPHESFAAELEMARSINRKYEEMR